MRSRGSPFALLQSCDNSCIIAKEKKQTMSFDQACCVMESFFCFRTAAFAAAATIVVQMIQRGNMDLVINNNYTLHKCNCLAKSGKDRC